ncbi:uncharacterized protein [Dermacentor andersoni]|uniref:uncharacterized protein isoform X2 n=1 Tax=Dermacentor andersoni TaxID=34620 RepID=UPI003B3A2ADB
MTSSPIVAFFRAFLLPREGIKAAVHRLTYELVFSGLALHTWRPGAARRQREGARRLGEWEFAVQFWMPRELSSWSLSRLLRRTCTFLFRRLKVPSSKCQAGKYAESSLLEAILRLHLTLSSRYSHGFSSRRKTIGKLASSMEFAVLFWMSQFEHHIPIVKFKGKAAVSIC